MEAHLSPSQTGETRGWRRALRDSRRLRRLTAWVRVSAGPATTAVLLLVPTLPVAVQSREVPTVLGTLLAAQAAVAAIAIAVTVFVLQSQRGTARLRGAAVGDTAAGTSDFATRHQERVLDAYELAAASARTIMAVFFVGATGLAYVIVQPGDGSLGLQPLGLQNLALAGLANLGIVLAETGLFYERARRMSRPVEWRRLVAEADRRLVADAAESYVRRLSAAAAVPEDEPERALRLLWVRDSVESDAGVGPQNSIGTSRS